MQGEACDVTFRAVALEGEFIRSPINTFYILTLASIGQEVLATPKGLAEIWGVEPRVVRKILDNLRPIVTTLGDGYVRTLRIDESLVISERIFGSTSDLSISLAHGYKMPDGPVSLWRGRGLSPSIRKQVMQRDGSVCTYCKSVKGPFHIDHVVPVAKGGTDDLSNLTVSCAGCNLAKSDMTVEAFKEKAGIR